MDKVPKIEKCFICDNWFLTQALAAIEVPDQGGKFIQKWACFRCLYRLSRDPCSLPLDS